jgi:hypothetical protein
VRARSVVAGIALVASLAGGGRRAGAQEGDRPLSLRRRTAAAVAAVVPGLVLHGSGHFVAGDRPTALRLLAIEAVGLGAVAGGIAVLALTGASRQLSAPIFSLPALGAGLLAISGLADLYGVLAPEGGRGTPVSFAPAIEERVGARYVYDPTVAYGFLLGPALDLRWRGLRLSPAAWLAAGEHNVRLTAEVAYRPFGPRPQTPTPAAPGAEPLRPLRGSYAEVVAGVRHHRYGPEAFDLTVLDVAGQGRVDLDWLVRTAAGSFAEWGWGLGLALTHYHTGAGETDGAGLLLARFAYGIYLGRDTARRGEVMIYYDHRHDDYTGGLKLTGVGSGVAGHLGLDATWFFSEHWGVKLEAQVGSAYLGGLAVIHRLRPGRRLP